MPLRRTVMNGIIRLWRLAAIVAVLMTAAAPAVSAYPVDPNWSPPTTVYIPETGQSIDGLFLELWRSGGGALSYGNPITPEITEAKGTIVQYYQYARFEYWPEGDANGNTVLLGNIGEELRPVTVRRSPGNTIDTKDNRSAISRGRARRWSDRSQECRPWWAATSSDRPGKRLPTAR